MPSDDSLKYERVGFLRLADVDQCAGRRLALPDWPFFHRLAILPWRSGSPCQLLLQVDPVGARSLNHEVARIFARRHQFSGGGRLERPGQHRWHAQHHAVGKFAGCCCAGIFGKWRRNTAAIAAAIEAVLRDNPNANLLEIEQAFRDSAAAAYLVATTERFEVVLGLMAMLAAVAGGLDDPQWRRGPSVLPRCRPSRREQMYGAE